MGKPVPEDEQSEEGKKNPSTDLYLREGGMRNIWL